MRYLPRAGGVRRPRINQGRVAGRYVWVEPQRQARALVLGLFLACVAHELMDHRRACLNQGLGRP